MLSMVGLAHLSDLASTLSTHRRAQVGAGERCSRRAITQSINVWHQPGHVASARGGL